MPICLGTAGKKENETGVSEPCKQRDRLRVPKVGRVDRVFSNLLSIPTERSREHVKQTYGFGSIQASFQTSNCDS